MRMGRRGDRYYSSEQALNKLLSIQCAFLEQRDETLNGVLHTLLLLGRGHAATIDADAQRQLQRRRRATRGAGRCKLKLGFEPGPGGQSFLDDLIRPCEYRLGDRQADGPGGLEVD